LDKKQMNNPKYIIIHSSDVGHKTVPNQFKNINDYHRDVREFPISSLGYFIGYHQLITGDINYVCRKESDVGAHCNQQLDGVSMNFQSLGVCVGFDGDVEYPSQNQYNLLQQQVWHWQDKYAITNDKVFFHRKFATWKTCPGGLITDAWLKQLLMRPVTTPASVRVATESCTFEKKEIEKQNSQIFYLRTFINFLLKYIK